jgi:hypothetical protein
MLNSAVTSKTENKMKQTWQQKLMSRWNLVSLKQVYFVLLVFACTGFTVLFLKRPILDFFGVERGGGFIHSLLYFILVLPLYQVILLLWGAVFGQFHFFWEFEKRMIKRIFGKK